MMLEISKSRITRCYLLIQSGLWGVLATAICYSCGVLASTELHRFSSPDKRVEAVWVLHADIGGATSHFVYSLYIVPRGGKVIEGEELLTVERISDDFAVIWRANGSLDISYKYAQILHFQNWWYSPQIDSANYVVQLSLSPADNDTFLSPVLLGIEEPEALIDTNYVLPGKSIFDDTSATGQD